MDCCEHSTLYAPRTYYILWRTVTAPLDAVLEPLEGVQKKGGYWLARCPAHEDHHQSLSVSEGSDGRVLFYCHAGCERAEVLAAMHLDWTDLFPSKEAADMVVAEYEYRDVDGSLLFVVERRAGKRFLQRRPLVDGTWSWKLDGVKRVLYRARQLRDAIQANKYVFVVEGEKDVHSLERLGFTATCNAGGAGKWMDSYTQQLAGAKVVVLPDNDEPGQSHAMMLMGQLAKKCRSFQIIELPGLPPKGDVSDWISSGGTAADLKQMVLAAGQSRFATPSFIRKASDYAAGQTNWLWYPRLPKRHATVLAGPQGSSKSYLTLALAAALSTGSCLPDGGASPTAALQGHAPAGSLFITYEDDVEETILPRLGTIHDGGGRRLEADLDLIRFIDMRDPDTGQARAFRLHDMPLLRAALEDFGECRLLVIDPAASLQVGTRDGPRDPALGVRAVLEPLTQLAKDHDLTVLLVKHVNKGDSGSGMMRVDGSGAWTQVPRSVLICGSDQDDWQHKGLQHVKANLSHRADPVEYWVNANGFRWGGRVVGSEADRLAVRELLKTP